MMNKFKTQSTKFQRAAKHLENGFKLWISKQSIVVEAAVVTTTSAAQGAAIGAFMGTLTGDAPAAFAPPPNAALNPQAMASLKQAQALAGGPLIQARNFAVMIGVNAENGFKLWLSKQSIIVEAVVVTTTSAAQGAAIGAFMGTHTGDAPAAFAPPTNAALNPQVMASLKQAQALAGGPLIQARNFSVMTGVNAGITCVLK
ncbi:hypothetical protein RYX36_013605, partial [Vicia faba]